MRRVSSLVLIAAVLCTAGCHSLARICVTPTVRTADGDAQVLRVWIDAPGPAGDDEDLALGCAISGLLLFPLESLLSAYTAVTAVVDPDLEIRWGPVGTVLGIGLPWVTLLPYVYGPYAALEPPEYTLDRAEFAELVARTRAGDGVAAYREIIADYPWDFGERALLSVELPAR